MYVLSLSRPSSHSPHPSVSQVATGTCAVLVHDGERSLVANLAAANTFTSSHLSTETAQTILQRSQIIYSAGFFLTVSLESELLLARHAADNNKIFTMNLSAPFIVDYFSEQLSACLPYVDYLFANESEALAYGKQKEYGSNIETIALKIASQPKASGSRPRVVVFTQGAESTIVAVNGKIQSYAVEPLAKENLIDTNGAGDAFVGGFLSRLALGQSVEECVRAGHYASRVIIQRSGCTFPKECDFV
jgi:adenosine kinase